MLSMNDAATPNTRPKTDAKREKILDAAWQRLNTHGLNKTTMAEIANDCEMSAANLYRYFKNKNEIAAACCVRSMDESATELRKVVKASSLSAAEKLRQYALRLTELNQSLCTGDHISELVANMTLNNADIIHQKIAEHHSRIAEILAQGNANNEFDVYDVVKTAGTVYNALVAFDVPLFADMFPPETYRKMAIDVVNILISGIANRSNSP